MFYQAMMLQEKERYTDIFYINDGDIIKQHYHCEIEILFVLEGQLHVKIDESAYVVLKNDMIIINSLECHEIIGNAKVLLVECGYAFLGSYYNSFSWRKFTHPQIKLMENDFLPKSVSHDILFTFQTINRELDDSSECSSWLYSSCIYKLFYIVGKYFPTQTYSVSNRRSRYENVAKIEKVLDYVQENYMKPITIDDVSKIIAYNHTSFSRLFKSVTNVSFHKYLNIYRMEKASQLLRDSDMHIYEVGHAVGLPVPKSFCRLFKEITGFTPTDYRQTKK